MDNMIKTSFITMANNVAGEAHQNAVKKGFWDRPRNDGEAIALMHSELSECLEAIRENKNKSDKIPEFFAVEEELADVVIRIMDYAVGKRLDVAGAVIAKIEYNAGREYKHRKGF